MTLAGAVGLALAVAVGSAQAGVVVSYPNFGSTAGLTLKGNAGTAVTGDGTVLRLAPAAGGKTGAAYSTSAITLGAGATFSTTFQFRFTSPGGWDPADGITFILAKATAGIGGAGVGMGYSGVPNSVAIEFDTYNNAGYNLGNNDGNSSNHVSVDTNGKLTNTAVSNVYGNGSCGFPGGHPAQNSYATPGCMSNGDLWSVVIGYNGSQLSVSLTDPAMGYAYNAINNLSIDIASILGTNNAFVGFTAGTGSGWENHDIVNWQFANTTQLAQGGGGNVPEPATLVIAMTGLCMMAGMARRRKS